MSSRISRFFIIKLLLVVTIVFLFTFLRSTLILLLPLFITLFLILFNSKISKNLIFLFALAGSSILVGSVYIGEFHSSNYILSIYIIGSLSLLFFSKSNLLYTDGQPEMLFGYFIKVATYFLLINNCIGFVQLISNRSSDDVFIGMYGEHGLGVHTLCLVNFAMGSYYAFKYKHVKTWSNLFFCLFFVLSGLVSFFGLGLIVFIVSIVFYNVSLRSIIKPVMVSFVVIICLGYFLYLVRPSTLTYNYDNLKLVQSYFQGNIDEHDLNRIPRKVILYKNYFNYYVQDPILFLFGSGPGTFNSRTSFLLNGDYSQNKILKFLFNEHEPYYAILGAYSLWNSKLTTTGQFLDGTRNQPFSSIISILSEYGFFFFVLMAVLIFNKKNTLFKKAFLAEQRNPEEFKNIRTIADFLKFFSIFIFLLLFTDNYLEYPEVIFFYLITYKLIEFELNNFQDVEKRS